jgi:probable rRNA maturation factor
MKTNIISSGRGRIPRQKILRLIDSIAKGEKAGRWIVNIVFIDDKEMKILNKRYRQIDRSTDVLSFNIDNEPGAEAVLGEIYISMETAARYAAEDKIKFADEILQLCCHGMLHLAGYDHIKNGERVKMQEREIYYLGRIK